MIGTSVADGPTSRLAVSIACVVYLVGYAGYCFTSDPPSQSVRYLVYAVPAILAAPLLFQRSARTNKAATAYLLTYVSLGSLGYLMGVKDISFFLNDFIIMVLIIVSFVPTINVRVEHIRIVFLCSLAYFALVFSVAEHEVRLFQILESGTGSGLEKGYDNNEGGLLGPVYAVFFYATGARLQFVLALVMSLLGGKRIGVIAILVGVVALFLFRRAAALKEKRNRFIVLLAGLAVINIAASNLLSISEYLHQKLHISVHIEEIMLGRHAIAVEMAEDIDSRPLVKSLVGYGAGSANALATLISDGTLSEPHNDWLKILYDYGILGSIVITVFIALVFSSSTTGAVIALTNAIIMTTDNVVIYLFYQFPIVLMVAYSVMRESRASETANAPEAQHDQGQAGMNSAISGSKPFVSMPGMRIACRPQDADQQDGSERRRGTGSDRSHRLVPVRSRHRFKWPTVATTYYPRRAIRVPPPGPQGRPRDRP